MSQPSLIRRLAIPIAAAVVIAAGCAVSYHILHNLARPAETLRAPTQKLNPASENLGSVLAAAKRPGPVLFQRELSVPHQDVPNFLRHLEVAGAQKGWFVYNPPDTDAVLVMPAKELSELEALTQDPTGWVRRENERITPARGPESLDLVTVSIHVEPSGKSVRDLLQFLGIVTLAGMGLLTMWNIGYSISQIEAHRKVNKRRANRTAPHNRQGVSP